MDPTKEEDTSPGAVTLDPRTRSVLSHALQDIRSTVSQLQAPDVSPLAVLDATAVDALKELYYTVNTEDPLNAMPARRLVLEQRVVHTTLLPLVNAVHCDPAAEANQKRWSVPMYQTLRLLSVLSIPISTENDFLKPGCNLDSYLLKLRADLAHNRLAVQAFVTLLQYYIERKAEKQAALAAAEEAKLEDARIDNILRFFRNILCPPRSKVGDDITARDRGVHLALVAALVNSDFYSTLTILFSSREDAHAQYTDLVFLIADIYAQTYRHTTPRQMYRCYREGLRTNEILNVDSQAHNSGQGPAEAQPTSVFAEIPMQSAKVRVAKALTKRSKASAQSSGLRAAIQRERALIGGARAIATSARWTSRHSGGFLTTIKPQQAAQRGTDPEDGQGTNMQTLGTPVSTARNISIKRVVSARNAIQSKLSLNPLRTFQDDITINSDILCMLTAKSRMTALKPHATKSKLSDIMRKDFQEAGLAGVVDLTTELIDVCFEHFVKELRARIEETKTRSLGEETESLMNAQRSFLAIVGSVVGFQREKHGKVFKNDSNPERSLLAQIHQNCMKAVLESDFKIVKTEWTSVEAGVELETFQLVFRILVQSCESIKTNGKDEKKVQDIELATFAVLEMMKMLQGMAANVDNGTTETELQDGDKILDDIRKEKNSLTPRETALNTLEQLFEEQEFLNAPADLAKDFSAKLFSFRHLTNIVEVAHAFTTILLDERELARLQVTKKKSKKKTRKVKKRSPDKEEELENEVDADKNAEDEESKPGNAHNLQHQKDDLEAEKKASSDFDDPERGDHNSRWAVPAPRSQETRSKEKESEQDNMLLGDSHEKKLGSQDVTKAKKEDERDAAKKDDDAETPQGDNQTPLDNDEDREAQPDLSEFEASDDKDLLEPEFREVESVGIIRRFAHARAVQSLLLPLRAAICHASSLSGSIYNIPDGSGPLLSNIVIAKGAHVIAAIWRVAKAREKGALCGQFFTYGTMHLLGIALEAAQKDVVFEHSVLERFSVFARDVTKVFFAWLSQSPSLALDMFFPMDKGSCQAYATSISHTKALLEQKKKGTDSGNDSDVSALAIERRGNIDFEHMERRASERNARRNRTSRSLRQKMAEIRRAERGKIEEDEDVDDLDNLNIGRAAESSDSDDANGAETTENQNQKSFCRLRAAKKRREQAFDPFASGDERLESETKKKRSQRRQGRAVKQGQAKKDNQKVFSSSDEYREADMQLYFSDSEDEAHTVRLDDASRKGEPAPTHRPPAEAQQIDLSTDDAQARRHHVMRPSRDVSSDLSSPGRYTDGESDREVLAEIAKKVVKARQQVLNNTPGLRKRRRITEEVEDSSDSDDSELPGTKPANAEGNVAEACAKGHSSSDASYQRLRLRTVTDALSQAKTEPKRRRLVLSDDDGE